MEWNLKTIGIIIAIFLIGYILGLVEAAIKQKYKDKKTTRSEEKEFSGPPPLPLKLPNLLSLNRNSSNSLTLELEGQTISNKDELTPEKRRLLVNLLVELRPWLETTTPTPASPQAKSQPEKINNQYPTASAIIPPQSSIPPQNLPIPSAESIVFQINMILQSRLADSPLANQGIRLMESPTGGVWVYIGLDKYEGIDAIPDPEIKAFIRKVVAEWESST
ncbi:MAG: hypothetical protein ABIJ65_12635 [Chloroflexota bacterium]